MSLSRAIVFIAIFLGLSVAVAQQPGTVPPAAPVCDTNTRDSVGCPATATGTSIDGNVTTVPSATLTGLFKGAVPPNGFIVRVYSAARTPSPYINWLVSRICGQRLAPVVFPMRDTERVR